LHVTGKQARWAEKQFGPKQDGPDGYCEGSFEQRGYPTTFSYGANRRNAGKAGQRYKDRSKWNGEKH
jgi:hypothetical protein